MKPIEIPNSKPPRGGRSREPICITDEMLPKLFPGWEKLTFHLQLPALLRDGNATGREYGILAGLLAYRACNREETDGHFNVLEVGTFDGLGTLQLAINSPDHTKVFTVDLPEVTYPTLCDCSDLDLQYIGAVQIGERFQQHAHTTGKVEQIREDSAKLSSNGILSPASMDFVFIDGCHAYEYCKNDTRLARRLLRPGGILVWHDYMHPLWPGVTRYLNEFASAGHTVHWLGGAPRRLTDEDRTTLAFWEKPCR